MRSAAVMTDERCCVTPWPRSAIAPRKPCELAAGEHVWHDSTPLPWPAEVDRFFGALKSLDEYLVSDRPLGWSAERIFQGPVADALTHVGQLTFLRRLTGAPVRAENYARAIIRAGDDGTGEPPPRVEFG